MKERRALSKLQPYIPGRKREGAVKLASNENPLGPSPRALATITGGAARGGDSPESDPHARGGTAAANMHIYPDKNAAGLREAIARRHSRESGPALSPENVIVGNGSDEVLVLLAGSFLDPGDNIITAAHTFSQYAFSAGLFDAEVRRGAMKDGRFLLDQWLPLMDERTKAVYVCNPNNPTGSYVTQEELVGFIDQVSEDVLIVVDEAYQDYVDAPDFPRSEELLSRHENLVVLHTFSKIFGMAGLRVGYGLAAPEIIRSMQKVKQPFNVGSIAQEAAEAALEDHAFVTRSREVNAAGKARLTTELRRRGFTVYPTQANFLCMHVGEDAQAAADRIADGGVTVRPLNSFGMDEWIRVTIGTEEQNRLFLAAMTAAFGAPVRRP
jgi:histidinol-phosphate aminotransferase